MHHQLSRTGPDLAGSTLGRRPRPGNSIDCIGIGSSNTTPAGRPLACHRSRRRTPAATWWIDRYGGGVGRGFAVVPGLPAARAHANKHACTASAMHLFFLSFFARAATNLFSLDCTAGAGHACILDRSASACMGSIASHACWRHGVLVRPRTASCDDEPSSSIVRSPVRAAGGRPRIEPACCMQLAK